MKFRGLMDDAIFLQIIFIEIENDIQKAEKGGMIIRQKYFLQTNSGCSRPGYQNVQYGVFLQVFDSPIMSDHCLPKIIFLIFTHKLT